MVSNQEAKFTIDDLSIYYNKVRALNDITLEIRANEILAVFGPAKSGKSTFLRTLNRLNDLIEGIHVDGRVLLEGQDIYAEGVDVVELRRRVGMVFALPIALPGTIWENITYGPRLGGMNDKGQLDEIVERTLRQAALWDEVKDRLHQPARALSGGQQQRLCIARVLALEPEVILLDEPCSGLDPISTLKVEDSLQELKQNYTIVIVPHNVQQASRVADQAAFFLMGDLIEHGPAEQIFTRPSDKRTEDYVTGRFG
ncbi:MAG: phosphate ABC transporter ATP-binding protein PstB [Anaerolineae bacterium]